MLQAHQMFLLELVRSSRSRNERRAGFRERIWTVKTFKKGG